MADPNRRLIEGLFNGTGSFPPHIAAIALLVHHGEWLQREDFTDFIYQTPTEHLQAPESPAAFIHWDKVLDALAFGDLPSSWSARVVLAVAASLGSSHRINLADAFLGVDTVTTCLIANALITAAQSSGDNGPELLLGPHHTGDRIHRYMDSTGQLWAVPAELVASLTNGREGVL